MADLTDMGSPSLSLLQDTINKYDIVFADPQWTNVFLKSGIPFHIVVPSKDRKEEFLSNFRERAKKHLGGGNEQFCKTVGENWDEWIDNLNSLPALSHIELEAGEWIADCIPMILSSTDIRLR